MSSTCIVCSRSTRPDERVWDDRYGHPGTFDHKRCPACGHTRTHDPAGHVDPSRLYSDWYPRRSFSLEDWAPNSLNHGWSGWLRGERAAAFAWVPAKVRILDVGTGWGQSLGYHANRGCEVWGVDADENLQRVADKHGFRVRIGPFTAEGFEADSFDWITLDQVMEHLPDPARALADVWRILKPGGHAVVTTPNGRSLLARLLGRRWVHVHAPYHLHLFSRASLRLAAQAAGFTVETHATITNSAWYHFQWMHLVGLRPAGQRSPYWSREVPWRLTERAMRVLVAIADRFLGVNHLLARTLDLLRIGDNQVMVLRKPERPGT